MVILFALIFHWYFSLFFQTFFHHRYSAHGMYKMSRFWEKVFFLFSFIGQGSSYLSPYVYGILHRMHHAYADTKQDPHSPKYDHTLFAMMWRTRTIYKEISQEKIEIDEKFKEGVPAWHSFENFASHYAVRLTWVALYITFYIFFATEWWMFLFLPVHFLTGPLHGVVINWFAHKYGYVNFKIEDTSKNLLPLDILMLGESYHNNHHKRATNPNFGYRWFELDPVYPVIKLFDALHIIRLNK